MLRKRKCAKSKVGMASMEIVPQLSKGSENSEIVNDKRSVSSTTHRTSFEKAR